STGKPVVQKKEFTTWGYESPFTLYLKNGGGDGKNRVSTAKVWLNGELLFDPSDFSKKVTEYELPVDLMDPSTLEVLIESSPGSELTVWIEGIWKGIPPEVILEESKRVSTTVLPEDGAVIETTSSNGTHFILEIPENGIYSTNPEDISITPILSVSSLPADGTFIAGVRLEPSGLKMLLPSLLTIQFPSLPSDSENLYIICFNGPGGEYYIPPLLSIDPNTSSVTFQIMHFSEWIAYTAANCPDIGEPANPEDIYLSALACAERLGDQNLIEPIIRAWFTEHVRSFLRNADLSTFEEGVQIYAAWITVVAQYRIEDAFLEEMDTAQVEFQRIIVEGLGPIEEACLNSDDPCFKKSKYEEFAGWYEIADLLFGSLDMALELPDPSQFCGGIAVNLVQSIGVDIAHTIDLGDTYTIPVIYLNGVGEVITGIGTFVSSDPDSVEVLNSTTGEVLGKCPGIVTITIIAGCDAVIQTSVIVADSIGPPASIDVEPSYVSINVGGSMQLQAVLKNSQGGVLNGENYEFNWSVNPSNIIQIDSPILESGEWCNVMVSSAFIHALLPGVTTLTVASGSISQDVEVHVSGSGVNEVEISPSNASIIACQMLKLSAQARDLEGNDIPNAAFIWQSSDTSIATVDENGLVDPISTGAVTIIAISEGVSGYATIEIGDQFYFTDPGLEAAIRVGLGIDYSVPITCELAESLEVLNGVGYGIQSLWGIEAFQNLRHANLANNSILDIFPLCLLTNLEYVALSNNFISNALPLTTIAQLYGRGNLKEVRIGRNYLDSDEYEVLFGLGLGGVLVRYSDLTQFYFDEDDNLMTHSINDTYEGYSLGIFPGPVTISIGETYPFVAQVWDENGYPSFSQVIWSNNYGPSATVDPTGIVRGIRHDSSRIVAWSNFAWDLVEVNVVNPTSSIEVNPAYETIEVGETINFLATPLDAEGNIITIPHEIEWWTTNESVAQIDSHGQLTGVGAGETGVVAFWNPVQGHTSVIVIVPIDSVTVLPSSATMHIQDSVQLAATVIDVNQDIVVNPDLNWASDNTDVAIVFSNGEVRAEGIGTAVISAECNGVEGTATITVEARTPDQIVFYQQPTDSPEYTVISPYISVEVRDAEGDLVRSVGNPISIAIDNNPGGGLLGTTTRIVVDGRAVFDDIYINAPGTGYSLRASLSDLEDIVSSSFDITALPGAVASLTVAPESSSINAGGYATFGATVYDAEGRILFGRTITWSSSDPNIATIASDGVATGISPGTSTITATCEGVNGTATVTVELPPVASVEVSPSSASIIVGGQQQCIAVILDAGDNVLSGRTVTWASSQTGIATVDGDGLVSGVSPGTSTITASCEGVNGTATVTVELPPVAIVEVSPVSASIFVSGQQHYTAVIRDAGDNILSGRTVTWASSQTGIATVDGDGLVSGVSPGTSTITASCEGVNGTATVTVELPHVATVEVSPVSASIFVGGQQQYTAVIRDAGDNILSGRTVTWASSQTNVATVDGDGLVSGVSPGTSTITASCEGVDGTASITVNSVVGINKLEFDQQPESAYPNSVISPAVTVLILDSSDQLVTAATDVVTLSIESNAGGGVLHGTLSQSAVGGVATFDDLSIDEPGLGYTLRAESGTLIESTSSSFNILDLPTIQPDQINDAEADGGRTNPVDVSGSYFQTFTPSDTPLKAVELEMAAGGSFPAEGIINRIWIRSGSPAGPRIGSTAVFIPGPRDSGPFSVVYYFKEPISVLPGQTYAIEWDGTEAPIMSWRVVFDDNPYTGGNAFAYDGYPMANDDFIFTTYVPMAKIVFTSNRTGNYDIFSMNADGTGVTQLSADPATDSRPSFSPDGTQILFSSRRTGNGDIYVMNTDGTGVTQLTDVSAVDLHPCWSPDANKIVFESNRDGNNEIYSMNVDGTELARLTDDSGSDSKPKWSPDGSKILFVSDRDGDYELYVMNTDGTGLTQLTENEIRDGDPSWSPDGSKIAFVSTRDGNYEIYIMDADGSGVIRMSFDDDADWYPCWSPWGTKIVFQSNRDGDYEIYAMNADGTGSLVKLTDNTFDEQMPHWGGN
ncbi:Ig-like domain-containing protein, partial [Acidobacteriota bacterium]